MYCRFDWTHCNNGKNFRCAGANGDDAPALETRFRVPCQAEAQGLFLSNRGGGRLDEAYSVERMQSRAPRHVARSREAQHKHAMGTRGRTRIPTQDDIYIYIYY